MGATEVLSTEFYDVEYYEEGNIVLFRGNLKLKSVKKYNQVTEFIEKMYDSSELPLVMDFTDLETLNSSGIAAISLFLLKIKDDKRLVNIIASKTSYWQTISLQDLGDLNENVVVDFIVKH